MKITIDHHGENFNINLHRQEGADPFLSIKGCRIVEGKNGPFVSYPATKNQSTGKYWNHVYGGEKFNEEVLKLAGGKRPARPPVPSRPAHRDMPEKMSPKEIPNGGFADMDDDIPF